MSRVAQQIEITKDDIKKLNAIINNEFNSKELRTRCKAILLAGEGLKNNEISDRLGVRCNSVGDWRKAWLNGGIDAITSIVKTGRPRGNGRKALNEILEKEAEIRTDAEGVKLYGEQTGVSAATVYRALAEARGKAGSLRGSDELPVSFSTTPIIVDIAGLYVSDNEAAIILRSGRREHGLALDHGRMVLHSKKAEQYIHEASNENGMITITDALDIMSRYSETIKTRGRHNSLKGYLTGIIPAIMGSSHDEYTVIYYSNDSTMTEGFMNRRDMRTTMVSNAESWRKEVAFWIELLTSDIEFANSIASGIKRYTDSRRPSTDIIQWYRQDIAIPDMDVPPADEDPFSDPTVKNVVTVTATIKSRDGGSTTTSVTGKNVVPSASEFVYSDPTSFGNTVDEVDRGFGGLFQKARQDLAQGYMNDAVKKTV